jgi:hypothetical protein
MSTSARPNDRDEDAAATPSPETHDYFAVLEDACNAPPVGMEDE